MEYRKVGKWGLKISELGFGTWLTFGPQLDVDRSKEIIREAFKNGINFFDTAEAYQGGMAEYILSQALKEFKREDLVVSTKIFWGGSGPNDLGLSRKHLIEGTENSLKRLQMKYVDLVYCHRPDPSVPMEEVVLAMDYIIRSGMALYWGTSEWSAQELEEAHRVCKEWKCVEPIVEQPQYNMLKREKVEKEYLPIYEKYGMGLTTFSPLASGFLTGKYNNGIPKGSRLDLFPDLKKRFEEQGRLSGVLVERVEKLGKVARDLDIKLSQLAISWVLKNQHVSSVLLGVSNIDQFKENLSVIEVEKKLTEDVMKKIERIIE
ncbi:MAG: aldo/keto reductase [Thermotogae bacterium]|nr:aldo/keto reductase [Thermotogota bacterium]